MTASWWNWKVWFTNSISSFANKKFKNEELNEGSLPKFDTYVTRQLPLNGDRQFDPLVYQCIVRLPNVRAHACVDEDEDVDKDVDMDVDEDVRVFVLYYKLKLKIVELSPK